MSVLYCHVACVCVCVCALAFPRAPPVRRARTQSAAGAPGVRLLRCRVCTHLYQGCIGRRNRGEGKDLDLCLCALASSYFSLRPKHALFTRTGMPCVGLLAFTGMHANTHTPALSPLSRALSLLAPARFARCSANTRAHTKMCCHTVKIRTCINACMHA